MQLEQQDIDAARDQRRGGTTTSGGFWRGIRTLKLGFFGALTGADAQLGINIKDGEQLAVSQYNATNPARKVDDRSLRQPGQPGSGQQRRHQADRQ